MASKATNGVWSVMITPYTDNGAVDYKALEALIHWYEEGGVDGLFAVCQSSEMFYLSLQERVELARFVKKTAKVPVVASGHISYDIDDQVEEVNRIADTGVDAVILISNRFAEENAPADIWKKNLDYLLARVPEDVPLGFYECPYPYKHLITDDEIEYIAKTNRFHFLKDTCCDAQLIRHRLKLIEGTNLKLFNANAATILDSLQHGAAGFSGIMASFHPQLYVWLCRNWKKEPEKAKLIQSFMDITSEMEGQCYPVGCKYFHQKYGVPMTTYSRTRNQYTLSELNKTNVDHFHQLSDWFLKEMGI